MPQGVCTLAQVPTYLVDKDSPAGLLAVPSCPPVQLLPQPIRLVSRVRYLCNPTVAVRCCLAATMKFLLAISALVGLAAAQNLNLTSLPQCGVSSRSPSPF